MRRATGMGLTHDLGKVVTDETSFRRQPALRPDPTSHCVTWTRCLPRFSIHEGSQQLSLLGPHEKARKECTLGTRPPDCCYSCCEAGPPVPGSRVVCGYGAGPAPTASSPTRKRAAAFTRWPTSIKSGAEPAVALALKEPAAPGGTRHLGHNVKQLKCRRRGTDKEAGEVRGPCGGGK